MNKILFIVFTFLLAIQCTTSPTGRKQLRYLPESQLNEMGDGSYAQMKKSKRVLDVQSWQHQKVRCISDRLLKALGEDPAQWEVAVFEDPTPNAFALPGNNIGVHTGMIDLVANDDQLAAVIGHEIGHVKAHHGNERVSQQLLVQAGLVATQIYLGKDSQTDRTILAALGLGAQFGILLPYSRSHETEADELGVEYMAKAGFDPREASALWLLMDQKSGGKNGPAFLSTHPNPRARAQNLASRADALMSTFQGSKNHSASCPGRK